MDGCSRQNPAYRPAKEKPRSGGASLFPGRCGAGRGGVGGAGRVAPGVVAAPGQGAVPTRSIYQKLA